MYDILQSTGWPKKVSHYQESSLNRISALRLYLSSISSSKLEQECYKFVLNVLCDIICDVISCCFWSRDMGKINVYDKIKSWLKTKNKKMWKSKKFLHKSPSSWWLRNGIHSRAVAKTQEIHLMLIKWTPTYLVRSDDTSLVQTSWTRPRYISPCEQAFRHSGVWPTPGSHLTYPFQ